VRSTLAAIGFGLLLAACTQQHVPERLPNAAGLVRLPCGDAVLRPVNPFYCDHRRNYVTPAALSVMTDASRAMSTRYPGFVLWYMDASGQDGHRPFPPHLSHGDGREVDVALVYDDRGGRPLDRPPTPSGYHANINPRPGDPLPCKGVAGPFRTPDVAGDPPWRLDEARTRTLVQTLTADRRVRRLFLEPHLKLRLGLASDAKVHFQGCWAARHDDHIHVDVF